jgi:Glycosyltransferase family 87
MAQLGERAALRVGAVALALLVALTSSLGADYGWGAGPAIDALVGGDLDHFAGTQPTMGPLSLLLRAPLAAISADQLTDYRLGAVPCLLAAAALAIVLAEAALRRGATMLVAGVTVVLVVANPMVLEALHDGHPEEVLVAAMAVGAVLAAASGRASWAGVLLGLALATKQWALLAVPAVLLAAPAGRLRIGALAAAACAAAYLPLLVADPHAFGAVADRATTGFPWTRTGTVWGLVLPAGHAVDLGAGEVTRATPLAPDWLRAIAHPLVIGVAAAAALVAWRRPDGPRGTDVLLLLAFTMLARAALDPWIHGYYHVPFLLALVAWEALRRDGLPVASLVATGALTLLFRGLDESLDPRELSALYTLWVVPTLAWVGLAALGRRPRLALPGRVRPANSAS